MEEQNLVRKTKFGMVRGTTDKGALVWHNVPYGKEPSGSLRWQPPQDPDAWNDVYDASASRADALQPSEDWTGVVGTGDCLNLDIYSIPDTQKLPVLVFLHGPENITLSGFSAGGRNVMATLISPLFKGKYNRAVVFSGGMTVADPKLSAKKTAGFLAKLVVEDGIQATEEDAVRWLLCEPEMGEFRAEDGAEDPEKDMDRPSAEEMEKQRAGVHEAETQKAGNPAAEMTHVPDTENCDQKAQVRNYLYSLSSERLAGLIGGAGIRMSGFPHPGAADNVPEGTFESASYRGMADLFCGYLKNFDSMEKIMEDMEQDTSIPEDLKLLVIRNILNGRWFSDPVDRKYGAEDLWK